MKLMLHTWRLSGVKPIVPTKAVVSWSWCCPIVWLQKSTGSLGHWSFWIGAQQQLDEAKIKAEKARLINIDCLWPALRSHWFTTYSSCSKRTTMASWSQCTHYRCIFGRMSTFGTFRDTQITINMNKCCMLFHLYNVSWCNVSLVFVKWLCKWSQGRGGVGRKRRRFFSLCGSCPKLRITIFTSVLKISHAKAGIHFIGKLMRRNERALETWLFQWLDICFS